jgi:plastocyanin
LTALTRPYSRRVLSLATAGILAMAAVAPAYAVAPTTWHMNVGAEADAQAIQVNGFLPRAESINVGDTVEWTVGTGEFHTITFLSGGAQPPLVLPGPPPAFNPVAVAPAGGPSYDGKVYFNSGLLVKGQTYSLTFTATGDFPFLCLIHGDMAGTIHVANAGTPYPHTQRFYDRQAARAANHLLDAGRDLRAEGQDVAGEEPNLVVAGTGALLPGIGSLFVARFLPQRQVIKVGTTVNWTNIDPETPHTITFGPEPGGGTDPLATFAPSNLDGPGHATIKTPNQAVNSGFIGANFPFGTRFSATFTQPGVYPYICALHDNLGMIGVIQVVAGDPNEEGD